MWLSKFFNNREAKITSRMDKLNGQITLLDQGKIKDPILVEKLMWYKAYNVLNDLENE